ncbi:MAG: UDP-N-acetylglucosamine--N-acetylmuramyl-(pentapeptide) pyrophosphoryl-undecaprenol N-acetylglucosamine transferase [Pseudomonadota bacterium]
MNDRHDNRDEAPLVALAAGGTGGHMFPAEALASELKRRGRRVLLVTDARGERYAEEFPADEKFLISAGSPSVGGPVRKAIAAAAIAGGLIRSLQEFRRRGVAAAVGFGGYPSLPAMKAAALLRLPYGVHEQNGVLGRSNRLLAKGAVFVAHAFPALAKAPADLKAAIEVGNPVREGVAAFADAPYKAPAADDKIKLLVFGGSQGASVFSKNVPAAVAKLSDALRARVSVVQQARPADHEEVVEAYRRIGVTAQVAPFFKDLPERIADAHLVVARSGASTVTELSVIGRPSILAPLPIAMDDHQAGNAQVLSDAGGAVMIREGDAFEATLARELDRVLSEGDRLAGMADAARGRVKAGAASALADLVDEMLGVENDRRRAA